MKSSPQRPPHASPRQLAALGLPPETPADVLALARTACLGAPRLLAGFDPDAVGLVLVHPRSCAAQPDLARRGRVFAAVEPLDDLLGLARRLNLEPRRRPGWFSVLLVGIEASGLIFLAPTSRLDFERRAS